MNNKILKWPTFLLFLIIMSLGTGCTDNQKQIGENQNSNISKVHTNKASDQSVANHAKEKIITKEEISNVKAVNVDKELVVAIKVENFNRFRLKNIEKSVKSDLEKKYPDHHVFVSADKKMFWELEKIEQRLQKDNPKKKNVKKDLDKLKNLMKEQT
ncbi:YhcN/YlaJ family sporulation lipoprotein [Niallia sp. Krafla_26]|uniref:YhcN/YlaJ family sporulation lipoprotein n=1 Tax=Niallia sp. Krafla_26 TaxID=3064703 RepID=UPI003D172646